MIIDLEVFKKDILKIEAIREDNTTKSGRADVDWANLFGVMGEACIASLSGMYQVWLHDPNTAVKKGKARSLPDVGIVDAKGSGADCTKDGWVWAGKNTVKKHPDWAYAMVQLSRGSWEAKLLGGAWGHELTEIPPLHITPEDNRGVQKYSLSVPDILKLARRKYKP